MLKSSKMAPKMLPKSITNLSFGVRGPIFSILGGFLRSLIFDKFSIGKKSVKNLRFGVWGSAKRGEGRKKWSGRRVGRGPEEALESAEVWLKVWHALKPRSARRGRRIRMRHAARAPPPPYLSIGVCCSCWRFAICIFTIGVWFFIVFSIESCFRRFSKKLENLIENCSQNASKIY